MIALSTNPDPPHLHSCDPDSGSTSPQPQVTDPPAPNLTPSHDMFTGPRSAGSATTTTFGTTTTTIVTQPKPGPQKKRPKLSLQTTSLPVTFGKSTTGLSCSLSAGCPSTPTTKNTFNNAYNWQRATSSPAGETYSSKPSRLRTSNVPDNDEINNVPYQVSPGLRSILRNSPIPPALRQHSFSAPASSVAGNGHSGRRPYFPSKKQVHYRLPLDEEIKTVRFTAKHSDIPSTDSSPCSPDEYLPSDEDSDLSIQSPSATSDDTESPSGSSDSSTNIAARRRPKSKRKIPASERQIRAAALREGLPTGSSSAGYGWDNTPQSPVQKRRKRPRKWRWTLGPIENSHTQPITNTQGSPTSLPHVRGSSNSAPSVTGEGSRSSIDQKSQHSRGALDDLQEQASAVSIPLPDSLRSSPSLMSPAAPSGA